VLRATKRRPPIASSSDVVEQNVTWRLRTRAVLRDISMHISLIPAPAHPDSLAQSMKTTLGSGQILKRSLSIAGHRTSVSLEDAFWRALQHHAVDRGVSVAALVAELDAARGDTNLSSAIRVHLLQVANLASEPLRAAGS
jgi:predicted DNA-binding ribbon-helix-helix protein